VMIGLVLAGVRRLVNAGERAVQTFAEDILPLILIFAVSATGPRAHCRRCGEDYASAMHVNDLKQVLDQLGFDYRFVTPQGEAHYQDVCPACRRRALALHQGRSLGR